MDWIFDLQLFAEDGEETPTEPIEQETPEVVDDVTVDDSEAEPSEEDVEEYDEITYNKEVIKVPKSERTTLLQKGYNYDKVVGKLTETQEQMKAQDRWVEENFGKSHGIKTWSEYQQAVERSKQQAEEQALRQKVDQLKEQGYDPAFIEMYQRQEKLEMELAKERRDKEESQKKQVLDSIIQGWQKEHATLREEYGALVPDFDKMPPNVGAKLSKGYTLRDAWLSENLDAVLTTKAQSKAKEAVEGYKKQSKRGVEGTDGEVIAGKKLDFTPAEKEWAERGVSKGTYKSLKEAHDWLRGKQ